jgi:hypothetical protein
MPSEYQINLVSGIGLTTSTNKLVSTLNENKDKIIEELKNNPEEAIEKWLAKASVPAYYSDKWLYRWVAFALGIIVLIAGVGAIILAQSGKTIPDVLVALGSGAIGALAGLFAPTTRNRS